MSRTDQEVRAAVERVLPGVRADLERLVRIPGIAFGGFDHEPVERSAAVVADLLRGCGLETRVVRAGGQPAAIGHRPAPPGAPTVLLYAHHDVQPAGDRALRTSDPFEPVEREGRLYGRGAADDKAGVLAHVAALRAFGEDLPVGVVVFVEGEEEYGSASLERLLAEHAGGLRPDVVVVADSDNGVAEGDRFAVSLRRRSGERPAGVVTLGRALSPAEDAALAFDPVRNSWPDLHPTGLVHGVRAFAYRLSQRWRGAAPAPDNPPAVARTAGRR